MSNTSAGGRRVAVIDIGTNTLLLLVVAVEGPGRLRAVHDACRFGRLGQGLERSGQLAPEAVERSLAILREYRATMDQLGVDAVAAVGTQSLREARNSEAFTRPAAEILGVPVKVISGSREAELVHRAVAATFPALASAPLMVADVGGGSTEIIVAGPGGVSSFTSVPIGSVRLTERHLHGDPPSQAEVQALVADIDATLAGLELPVGARVVGTAGTATSIASVALALESYDSERVNGFVASTVVVEQQLARYFSLAVEQRCGLPGLEPERADVVAGGVAIFARLLRRVQAPELLVSDRGVRWGMAYELAAQ